MKVRRKSLWRSANSKRAKKFANMRAAKERKRIARTFAEVPLPDASHAVLPTPQKPTWTITIRHRAGEFVKLRIHDGPFGMMPSVTTALKRIGCVLKNYRRAAPFPERI